MASAIAVCDPCQERGKSIESRTWCMECEEGFCNECSEFHRSLKATKSHHVIDVKIKTLHSDIVKTPTLKCDRHPGIPLEYFCVDHDEICCRDCIAKTHKICQNTISLETAAKDVNRSHQLKDCKEHLTVILQTCNNITKNRNEKVKEIHTCRSQITSKISDIKHRFIENMNELEKKALEDLDKTVDTIVEGCDIHKSKAENLKEKMQSCVKDVEFLEHNGSEKQVFYLIHSVNKVLQDTDTKLQADICQIKDCAISFSESKSELPNKFGNIQVHEKKSDISYRSPNIQQAQMIADIPKSFETFDLENRIDIKGKSITGLAVTNDDKIILCDCQSTDILVYSVVGKLIKDIKTTGTLWDITIIPGKSTAVITHVSNEIEFINTDTLKIDRKVTVQNSTQLCGITSTEEHIFVGGIRTIHRLDKNGVILGSITIPKEAWYLSISSNNLLYYSCWKSVHCIQLDGTEIFSYQIPSEAEHRNIVFDKQSNIYIVGRETNTIHRLSTEGKFDKVILNRDNGLNDPFAVCFNQKCDKLYVSNYGDESVRVFKCK